MEKSQNMHVTLPPAHRPSGLRKFFVFVLFVVLIVSIAVSVLVEHSDDFTTEEHVARVTALAKKRYIKGDGKYTDLQVYPIYNQDDKLQYFLIELEPVGYVFVYMRPNNIFSSMYLRGSDKHMLWARYAVEKGSFIGLKDENGKTLWWLDNARWTELDENNEPIKYYSSPYKVANVLNEKMYLLDVKQKGTRGTIAAVKRDGKYLNLVSMEYIDYQEEVDERLWSTFIFSSHTAPKSMFNL